MSCRIDSLLSPHLFGVRSICIHFHPFASICNQAQARSITFTALASEGSSFYGSPTSLAGPKVHTMLILGAIMGQKSVQKEAKTGVPATRGKKWFRYVIYRVSTMSGTSTQSHFCGNSGCQIGVRRKVKKNTLQDTSWRLKW